MKARRLFALTLAAVLAGCSATGDLQETAPLAISLADHSTVRLAVSCENPDHEEVARLVEAKLAARLTRSGVFEQVVSSSVDLGEPTLELRARIVDLDRVSTTARVMVGGLAGRGSIELEIDLVRLDTGESVGSMVAAGKSSGGTIFAGTTTQAIEQCVDRVVAYLADQR